MANELDEMAPVVLDNGNDVNVIAKQLPVTISGGTKFFDIVWWVLPPIIGGVVWNIIKVKARNYFLQLQQKIQHDASQIDNYLEQRVQILKNAASLVNKAIEFDQNTFTEIAKLRAGNNAQADVMRNEVAGRLDAVARDVKIAFENYPDLAAHKEIEDALQQNSYLQREITAAREVYNDSVNEWNREVYHWPARQIVAAKAGYTTRIPFIADAETKQAARSDFFS